MPKNMILRLGVDASDFSKKMAKAGADAESTGKRIKKSMSADIGSEVSRIMGWGSSSTGVTGAISASNFAAAKSQLSILKSYRDQLADAGFDDEVFGQVSERIKVLDYELNAYQESLRKTAEAEREAAAAADRLGEETQQAAQPISEVSGRLRETDNSGRRLSIIPGLFQRIRSSAGSANGGLEKMVRTIRNVSVVSLGLRLARGLFGELGSIVRQYVSENAALQAQVNGLKSALGQALAPAINVVTNALSVLMPYVVGVSNAIGSLISNLFGSGWTTVAADANAAAKAIGGAGGAQKEFNRQLAGFDEITKLNAESSGGGGGGGSSSTTTTVEAKSFSLTEVGSKLASFINDAVSKLSTFIEDVDWRGLGQSLKKNLSDLFTGIDWKALFEAAGSLLGGIAAALQGLFGDAIAKVKKHFQESNDEAKALGLGVIEGFFMGMASGLGNLGTWLYENVIVPAVNGFRKALGLEPIEIEGQVTSIEDKTKNPYVRVQAVATEIKDEIPRAVIKVEGEANTFKDSTRNSTVDVQANATTFKDTMRFKLVDVIANPTMFKDPERIPIVKIGGDVTNLKVREDAAVVYVNAYATTFKDKLKNAQVSAIAKMEAFRQGDKEPIVYVLAEALDFELVRKPKIETTANITDYQDNIKNKSISFNANMISWTNNLKDTQVNLRAQITKDWTGSLADYLGISVIKTKLQVETPKISVSWSESKSPIGGSTIANPKFQVAYNAYGALFNGASLLGLAGGKFQVAGEAGREVLLNVDRHTWWMDLIADKVVARSAGGGVGGEQNITVNLVVDGKVLASTVVRNVNAQARATGRNPLAAYM